VEPRSDVTPLIVIVGETASGKSALALEFAQKFDGEIISADSWTVYRDFDIGTAKPSASELAQVPHHLLNIANPLEGFSAPEFKKRAVAAIENITAREKVPFLVGGTGLYVDSILFDYQFLAAPDAVLRQELSALSLDEIRQKITEKGIDTTGIDVRNKRRLIRLLETDGARPEKSALRENTLVLGVQVERDQLRARVADRVDTMLRIGLEDEVLALSQKYGWNVEPMKGIGYREWFEYFSGSQTLDQTRDRIISATMNLAKRQRTWFKRNNSIHWLTTEDKYTVAVDLLTTFLNK
jgi:tRNA dimethylallyltransferase